jgi:ribosomal protein S18 acetylase RimI-like enzyme
MSPTIRAFDPSRDLEGVRRCFIDLHDHEHERFADSKTGAELVDEYVPFMIARCTQPGSAMFVAEVDGTVVGFATAIRNERAEPDDTDAFHFELAELSVLASHRSRGIGTALMEAVEAHAFEHDASSLRVRVDCDNPAAQRLYERHGFTPTVITLDKVPGGVRQLHRSR